MIQKETGDGKIWILESVTAKTVSGKTVPTRKEMIEGTAEIWYISVPAEATVITLNWEELTQLTVSTLTVYNPYEYYSNETIISFEFLYSANSDPKTENLKITKDGKEVEILHYHYEFYTLEEKIGVCELSAAEGAGNYLLQIVHKGNVVKKAAFTVENKGEIKGNAPLLRQPAHRLKTQADNGSFRSLLFSATSTVPDIWIIMFFLTIPKKN